MLGLTNLSMKPFFCFTGNYGAELLPVWHIFRDNMRLITLG